MENIGWNYDYLIPEGKNVFFFRDTNHSSQEIQDRLLKELEKCIDHNLFRAVYSEGDIGVAGVSHEGDEVSFRELEKQNKGRCGAIDLLTFRNKDKIVQNELAVVCIEDKDLFNYHLTLLERAVLLDSNKDELSDAEREELASLPPKLNMALRERDEHTARTIATHMYDYNINSVGLVFGDLHYKGISSFLRNFRIGIIPYYPGVAPATPTEAREYLRKMADFIRK